MWLPKVNTSADLLDNVAVSYVGILRVCVRAGVRGKALSGAQRVTGVGGAALVLQKTYKL